MYINKNKMFKSTFSKIKYKKWKRKREKNSCFYSTADFGDK